MKYSFILYTKSAAEALVKYAKEQYVHRIELVQSAIPSALEVEVECSAYEIERLRGYKDCLEAFNL